MEQDGSDSTIATNSNTSRGTLARNRHRILLVSAKLARAVVYKEELVKSIAGKIDQAEMNGTVIMQGVDKSCNELQELNAYMEFLWSQLNEGFSLLVPHLAKKEHLVSMTALQCSERANQALEGCIASGQFPELCSDHLRALVASFTSILYNIQAIESCGQEYIADYLPVLNNAIAKLRSEISKSKRPYFDHHVVPLLRKIGDMLSK